MLRAERLGLSCLGFWSRLRALRREAGFEAAGALLMSFVPRLLSRPCGRHSALGSNSKPQAPKSPSKPYSRGLNN